MSKVKIVQSFVLLMLIALVSFPFVQNQLAQPRQREIQAKLLQRSFIHFRIQDKKVLFIPNPRRYSLLSRFVDSKGNTMDFSSPLALGAQWKAVDRHWDATYTLKNVDASGFEIYFEATGSSPSSVRASKGVLSFNWK